MAVHHPLHAKETGEGSDVSGRRLGGDVEPAVAPPRAQVHGARDQQHLHQRRPAEEEGRQRGQDDDEEHHGGGDGHAAADEEGGAAPRARAAGALSLLQLGLDKQPALDVIALGPVAVHFGQRRRQGDVLHLGVLGAGQGGRVGRGVVLDQHRC